MSTECLSPVSNRSIVEPNALVAALPVGSSTPGGGFELNGSARSEFRASRTTEECTETVKIQVFYPTEKSEPHNATGFESLESVFSTKLDRDATVCVISADRRNEGNARAA